MSDRSLAKRLLANKPSPDNEREAWKECEGLQAAVESGALDKGELKHVKDGDLFFFKQETAYEVTV